MKKSLILSTALVSWLVAVGAPALVQQAPGAIASPGASAPAASAALAAQSRGGKELPGLRLYNEAFQGFLEGYELLADTDQIAKFKAEWEHRFDLTDDLATEEGTNRAIGLLAKAGTLLGCPEQPDYKCLYVRALRAYMQYHYSPDSLVIMTDPAQRARWVAKWEHEFDNDPEAFKTEAAALRAIRLMRDSLGMRFDYVQGRQRTTEEINTRKANFGGLGLRIGMSHADDVVLGTRIQLLVHEPQTNSPASGQVHYGDMIVGIGDRASAQMTVAEVKRSLVGKPGSQLKLTVRRGGSDVPVILTRAYTLDTFSSATPVGDTDAGVPIEFKGEDELQIATGFELTADQPEQGTPADGKVKRGDQIIAVNDQTLFGKTVNQAVEMLRGDVDTPVKITLVRDGQKIEVTLKRASIEEHSVFLEPLADGVNLIHIRSFEALNVNRDFATAIAKTVLPLASQALKAVGDADSLKKAASFDELLAKLNGGQVVDDTTVQIVVEARQAYEKFGTGGGIILDLTNNPGGDLGMVKSIVGLTLPQGSATDIAKREPGTNEVVVTESFLTPDFEVVTVHQGDETKVHTVPRVPLLVPENMPFVVLINGVSASGSEWLAGTLQANHRVRLIGKDSRGKEEGQEGVDLPYGLSLHITDFEFFPGGRKANWTGLVVDRDVAFGDGTPQLNAAREEVAALGKLQVQRRESERKALASRHEFFDRIMRERAALDAQPAAKQDPEYQR
jgi:C-terminal processing protease CtpA/Prc